MRKFRTELFHATCLSWTDLARDDSWYVSLDGGVSEEENYLPIGRVPDLDDGIIGYTFGTFDGNYDFLGIDLHTAEPWAVLAHVPTRQLRIDRVAHQYRNRTNRSRSFWS